MKKLIIYLYIVASIFSYNITKWDKPIYYTNPSYDTTLQILYLGSGGYLFRLGEDAILTSPFFSNFSLVELAFPISPKKELIDRIYPNIPEGLVKGILVGHSHYDHLIDLPYIWNQYHKNTPIYGSLTTKNLLLSVSDDKIPEEYLKVVEDNLDIYQYKVGSNVDIVPNKISFMPIESSHSAHLFGYKLFKGTLDEPRKTPPKYAKDWVEGDTYAYLIKFQKGNKTFTVYYQDAASSPPKGLFNGFQDTEIDLAILCVGGFSEAENYPEYILEKLKPKKVIMGHWEDFMSSQLSSLDGINNPKRLTSDAVVAFENSIKKFNESHGTNIEFILPMLWKNYNFPLQEKNQEVIPSHMEVDKSSNY